METPDKPYFLITHFGEVLPARDEFTAWLGRVGGKEAVDFFNAIENARALSSILDKSGRNYRRRVNRLGIECADHAKRQLSWAGRQFRAKIADEARKNDSEN